MSSGSTTTEYIAEGYYRKDLDKFFKEANLAATSPDLIKPSKQTARRTTWEKKGDWSGHSERVEGEWTQDPSKLFTVDEDILEQAVKAFQLRRESILERTARPGRSQFVLANTARFKEKEFETVFDQEAALKRRRTA